MHRVPLSLAVLVVVSLGLGVAFAAASDDDHAVIEHIMKDLHKGKTSVAARATQGQATAEEIAKLAEAYPKMLAAKPPRGDEADWKKRCEALIAATALLAKGEANAAATYKQAVNCKACHQLHKPD